MSTFVQSSQESTLTEVTSIGVRDRDESTISVLEENDEVLHLLVAKREELLLAFRALNRCLINEKEEKV